MPLSRSRRSLILARDGRHALAIASLAFGALFVCTLQASTDEDVPTAIRSRDVELHYRLSAASPSSVIELWYTRDRGATWQRYGRDDDRQSPIVFVAPAEGLYGFILQSADANSTESPAPARFATAQRWVFIDYTPPLVQWETVEPADDMLPTRQLQLRWTAYDDNCPGRPVALAYQTSVDQTWKVIDPALPNVGRYDWVIPPGLSGQITFRLTIHDLGGHIVERLHGPLSLQRWLQPASRPATQPAAASSRPALASTRPADGGLPHSGAILDAALLAKAESLYKQGSVNLMRGEYALAAERFTEALEINPDLLPALNDLAGIRYTQRDYDKAIRLYNTVLAKDPTHLQALRGAALAYAVRKQYPQARDALNRILAVNSKDAEAWLDLGDVTFMMGDSAQAQAQWSRATALEGAPESVARKARRRLEIYAPTRMIGTADARPTH